ncbi:MAG: hypothetical protein J5923_07425, partial [Acidaminococcaceae bacterium]|nr:hypothetical protein [Acidaminococcaceae bacterium]
FMVAPPSLSAIFKNGKPSQALRQAATVPAQWKCAHRMPYLRRTRISCLNYTRIARQFVQRDTFCH